MLILLIGITIVLLLLLAPSARLERVCFAALVVSVMVFPKALTAVPTQYVGIATRTPVLYSFSLLAAVLAVLLIVRAPSALLLGLVPWVPFLVLTLYLWRTSWPTSDITDSGMLQITTGIVIFAISFAETRSGAVQAAAVSHLFSACILIQGIAVMSDLLSLPLYTAKSGSIDGVQGFIVGFTGHAEILGKLLVIGLAGVLCCEPESRAQRLVQYTSAVSAVTMIALTQGRVAFLAALLLLVLFALLQVGTSRRILRRYLLITATVVSLASAGTLSSRFQVDPSGGGRDHLMAVATSVLSRMPFGGVGLNEFVDVIGGYDPLVGSGVPVHNAYLLLIIETGFVTGVLFWIPLIVLTMAAWRRRRRVGIAGNAARITLASVPGLLIICYEGWSLPSTPLFQAFALVYGSLLGLMFSARRGRPVLPSLLHPAFAGNDSSIRQTGLAAERSVSNTVPSPTW